MCYYQIAMRTLILFTSATGSAEKYAKDIATALSGDVFPLKKFKWKTLPDYDLVIYGGWVMGGKIKGVDDFLSHYDEMEGKDVIIFSTGMVVPSKEGRKTLIDTNILDLYHVRYYQLRGSFDMSKLGFIQRSMIKMYFRQIEEDAEANPGYKALLEYAQTPLEYYDQEGVEKIISVAKKIESEKEAK